MIIILFYSPMTLFANDFFFKVARPRSPIFTKPVLPFINMLSHFKSRCMIGGVLVCRKCSPFRICRHQLLRIFSFTPLNRLRYLYKFKLRIEKITRPKPWIFVPVCKRIFWKLQNSQAKLLWKQIIKINLYLLRQSYVLDTLRAEPWRRLCSQGTFYNASVELTFHTNEIIISKKQP